MTALTAAKSRSESSLRWGILAFTSLMMIANYYCYDIPAALNSQMDDYFGKKDNFATMFSLLYTVYSIPNIVLPFFGGYFVDKLGVRVCLLIFSILISIGQLVVAIGLSSKSWPLMLLGRVIYGFGGENLGVANSAILSVWFEGKELAFAFGLNLSVARLGSVINNMVSPAIANGVDIQFAMWFGTILCASSIASVLLIGTVDKLFESRSNEETQGLLASEDEDSGLLSSDNSAVRKSVDRSNSRSFSSDKAPLRVLSTTSIEDNDVKFRDIFDFQVIFWITTVTCVVVYGCVLPFNNIASALLLERDYFMEPPSECHLMDPTQCQSATNVPVDCPSSKWYQPPLPDFIDVSDIDCSDSYYSDVCTVSYCDRQSDAQVQANTVMSIPYIISASLSPFLGSFVDRFGLRAVIATLSPAALMIVHLCMGYADSSPIGPMIGQGLAYACFAAVIWPSVALIVEKRLVGLGYGVIVAIQNMGLAGFPLIIAAIYSADDNHYIPTVEVFFVVLAILGVVIGLYLNYYDYYYMNHVLNKSGPRNTPEDEEEDVKQDVL